MATNDSGDLVITIPTNKQSYTFQNVGNSLTRNHFTALDSAMQDMIHAFVNAEQTTPDSDGSKDEDTAKDPETDPKEPTDPTGETDGDADNVYKVFWNWGTDATLNFNPETDKIDFGWMTSGNIEFSQQNDGLHISVVGNQQSYKLENVNINDLSADHFIALDASLQNEIDSFIDGF